MSNKFKIEANTLDYRKEGVMGEQGIVTSLVTIVNLGSQTQGGFLMEVVNNKGGTQWEAIFRRREAPWLKLIKHKVA